jgi:hypothetical protein
LQAALCGARITMKDDRGNVSNQQPVGGAIVLGIGYEWWVGDEWGLGVLGRLTGATLNDDTFTHHVSGISLLATLTYN